MLSALLAAVLAAEPTSEVAAHPVPVFLPRSVTLGVMFNPPVVTPHVRLSWEVSLLEQPHNDFVLLLQVGTGAGSALPTGMASLYEHVALAGVGYRSTRTTFHWGFNLKGGPLWYRAGWAKGSPLRFEDRVVGYTELSVRLGLKLARHFLAGIEFGYAAPVTINTNFPANVYCGGVQVALFADWR